MVHASNVDTSILLVDVANNTSGTPVEPYVPVWDHNSATAFPVGEPYLLK